MIQLGYFNCMRANSSVRRTNSTLYAQTQYRDNVGILPVLRQSYMSNVCRRVGWTRLSRLPFFTVYLSFTEGFTGTLPLLKSQIPVRLLLVPSLTTTSRNTPPHFDAPIFAHSACAPQNAYSRALCRRLLQA